MRRLFALVVCVVGLSLVTGATPASAQVVTPPVVGNTGTWVGQVERHAGHFDYVGSACPIEADFCIQIIARYRIVPTTAQAALALPRVAGGQATLSGRLLPLNDGTHMGLLFVSRVS